MHISQVISLSVSQFLKHSDNLHPGHLLTHPSVEFKVKLCITGWQVKMLRANHRFDACAVLQWVCAVGFLLKPHVYRLNSVQTKTGSPMTLHIWDDLICTVVATICTKVKLSGKLVPSSLNGKNPEIQRWKDALKTFIHTKQARVRKCFIKRCHSLILQYKVITMCVLLFNRISVNCCCSYLGK